PGRAGPNLGAGESAGGGGPQGAARHGDHRMARPADDDGGIAGPPARRLADDGRRAGAAPLNRRAAAQESSPGADVESQPLVISAIAWRALCSAAAIASSSVRRPAALVSFSTPVSLQTL